MTGRQFDQQSQTNNNTPGMFEHPNDASFVQNESDVTRNITNTATVVTTQTTNPAPTTRELLVYPRNFFNRNSGVGPANAEQAKRFWMYRKARRRDGLADTEEEPDGNAMLQEIKQIRDSLRQFIFDSYMDGMRERAKEMNILIKGQSSHPTTIADFRLLLNDMQSTLENQRKVVELVHLFHRDRHWLSAAIDKWMLREGMCLAPLQKPKYVDGKRTRSCPTDRGGFSAVARSAKSQIVGGFMAPMLRNAGWSVSLTKGQGKKNSYEHRVKYNESLSFYVVVRTNKVSRMVCVYGNVFVLRTA